MKVFSLELFKKFCEEVEEPFSEKNDYWAVRAEGKRVELDKLNNKYIIDEPGFKNIMIEPMWVKETKQQNSEA